MVSVLDSGSGGPGLSPGGSLCCFLGQDTTPQCLSAQMSINGYQQTVRET